MYGIVVVSRARHPEDVGLVELERGDELVGVGVDPEVDDLEAGALEHHPDEVLADVVDVALDGPDDDLADRLARRSRRGAAAGSPCRPSSRSRRGGPRARTGSRRGSRCRRSSCRRRARRRGPASALQPRPSRMFVPSTISSRHAVVQVVVHLLDELVVGQSARGRCPRSRPRWCSLTAGPPAD